MGTMEGLSDAERVRYARHLTLPQVGAEGQRRLKSATIVCVGAGGLGSPALLYLAAAGIGTLRIIDDDRVDITNLQRQIVHPTAAIGTAKVESARASLTAINPEVAIEMFDERLNADNALDLLRGSDCVIDGTDNLASRFLLNDACEVLDLPWVHASVFRFEGQVTTFNLQEGPNYRDLLPSPPPRVPHHLVPKQGCSGCSLGPWGCCRHARQSKSYSDWVSRCVAVCCYSMRWRWNSVKCASRHWKEGCEPAHSTEQPTTQIILAPPKPESQPLNRILPNS